MTTTNDRNQAAFSSIHHVDNAQNMEYAHRGGPSSPDAAQDDRGIQKIDSAMTKLTMTGTGCGVVPAELSIPSAKENVRPNSSGKKKHWRKKASQDLQRHEAVGDDVGSTTTTTRTVADGGGIRASTADEAMTKNGKALQLKNKKPVVVEISSSQQPQKKTPAVRPILPSMDFEVAADAGGHPASINEDLTSISCGDGGEQEKKPRPKKNKKLWRKKPQAAKKGDVLGGSMDVSTNAGGASVLALLGQYPYVMPSAFDVYDGYTPHSCSQMTMTGAGESCQQAEYDPPNFSSIGAILPPAPHAGHHAFYPYAATAAHGIHHGPMIMMPGGYYVPAMMNDETVYYNQPNAVTNENVPYYHHACYSPYVRETMDPSFSVHRYEGDDCRGKSPLNIYAPEFDPKENK